MDKKARDSDSHNSAIKLENIGTTALDLDFDPDAGLSAEERAAVDKKLLRKLDWQLIPWLSFLYLISFLDRCTARLHRGQWSLD